MSYTSRSCRRLGWTGSVVAALLVAAQSGATAPGPDIAAVKASMFFHFAEFVEWPSLPAKAPIVLCVVGDEAFGTALIETARGQNIATHPAEVRRPADSGAWRNCQLLFVTDAETRRAAVGLTSIKSTPVLTVSDGKGFANGSGIVELYLESSKLRFAINVEAAERAGLRISSKLLLLAKITRDSP